MSTWEWVGVIVIVILTLFSVYRLFGRPVAYAFRYLWVLRCGRIPLFRQARFERGW
jgi:hypothetical protein